MHRKRAVAQKSRHDLEVVYIIFYPPIYFKYIVESDYAFTLNLRHFFIRGGLEKFTGRSSKLIPTPAAHVLIIYKYIIYTYNMHACDCIIFFRLNKLYSMYAKPFKQVWWWAGIIEWFNTGVLQSYFFRFAIY